MRECLFFVHVFSNCEYGLAWMRIRIHFRCCIRFRPRFRLRLRPCYSFPCSRPCSFSPLLSYIASLPSYLCSLSYSFSFCLSHSEHLCTRCLVGIPVKATTAVTASLLMLRVQRSSLHMGGYFFGSVFIKSAPLYVLLGSNSHQGDLDYHSKVIDAANPSVFFT